MAAMAEDHIRLEPSWKARVGDYLQRDDMQALSAFLRASASANSSVWSAGELSSVAVATSLSNSAFSELQVTHARNKKLKSPAGAARAGVKPRANKCSLLLGMSESGPIELPQYGQTWFEWAGFFRYQLTSLPCGFCFNRGTEFVMAFVGREWVC